MEYLDLAAIFREEAEESVGQMLDLLEDLRGADGERAEAMVRQLFRVAHNIKGAARAAGVEPVERAAHAIEDALATFKDTPGRPPTALLDQILLAVVGIQKLLAGEQASERRPATGVSPADNATMSLPEAADVAPEADDRAETVRIRTDRLNQLMSLTGELVGTQARLGHRREELEALREDVAGMRGAIADSEVPKLRRLLQTFDAMLMTIAHEDSQFANLTEALNGALKRVRMLPVRSQSAHWSRIVRETAIALGRDVRLDIDVGDAELDKNILDALRDPLVHLLRNAVDHGIEAADQRRAAGKPEQGRIWIRTRMLGQRVELLVGDDGRGIDGDAVAAKAVQAGLITPGQRSTMSPAEKQNLVFASGFSTRTAVTEISGRGLGLDIVRDRVEALGGTVAMPPPHEGQGTVFQITVPVSMVSSRGLAVRGESTVYVLPIEMVVRSLHVQRDDLRDIDGQIAVEMADDEPLRLRWLTRWMDEPEAITHNVFTVVVLQRGTQRVGLVVTEVLGEQTYVTRRLPGHFLAVEGVAGAVVLPDGRLAPVLDVPALLNRRGQTSAMPVAAGSGVEARRVPHVLVVDDSLTSRTLERNILTAAGYEVTTAVDGEEGWAILQTGNFDLVVSDVEMPRLTGLEFTRRIRATPRFERLPVILVTSLGSKHDLAEGAAAGANEYIVKGRFDQTQLIEAVARLL